MRKLYASLLIIAVLCTAIFFACTKTDSLSDQFNPGPTVTASVKGRVTGTDKRPIKGAIVSAGTSTATTDLNGEFTLNNAQLSKKTGLIKVTKDGFYHGSRTFTVSSNTNYVTVQLIPKTVSGIFDAGTSSDINAVNGGRISFTPNSIKNATTGAAYSGNVSVSAFFLDPEDDDFNQYMPGDLRGINSSNQERFLKSFGMMAVELNGAGGEQLQLADGKTASITFPVPASLQSSAPATIPLWHFDETKGMWVEEGTATLQGNNYVGTVGHFSFWNCDNPCQSVFLETTFHDGNGNPVQNQLVWISSSNWGTTSGWTDNNGYISGMVPFNDTLIMTIHNSCNNILYQQTIGPFSTNTNLGVISVPGFALTQVNLSGTAINCSGGALTNGYVQILLENGYYNTPVTNGNFSITVTRCDNIPTTAQLQAVDLDASQQGTMISIPVTSGNTSAGQLIACGVSTAQYINLTLNGVNYTWAPPTDSVYSILNLVGGTITTSLNGYRTVWVNQNDYLTESIGFSFQGSAQPGNYLLNNISIYLERPTWVRSYHASGLIFTNVAEYGGPGGYIGGSFTGNVIQDSTGAVPVPVSCNYRVQRF